MAAVPLHTAVGGGSLDTATVNTLNALYPTLDSASSHPTIIPAATTLVAAGTCPPEGASLELMQQLTSGARATAAANFYDSVSAGPFSEACNGEFTDVGVWLGCGRYQQGHENDVLAALGLEAWMRPEERITVTTRAFEVPAVCHAGFSTAYRNLKDIYCFCVYSGGDTTACFLLGEIQQQWCGVVSIAIVSD